MNCKRLFVVVDVLQDFFFSCMYVHMYTFGESKDLGWF